MQTEDEARLAIFVATVEKSVRIRQSERKPKDKTYLGGPFVILDLE
jgi:hypothetical protein